MRLVGKHLPARDFAIVASTLAAVTVLAWVYLFVLAADMEMGGGAMTMPDGNVMQMPMAIPEWTPAYFLLMFLMWAVMMAGMMIPSVTPTVMIYASVARKASSSSSPVPSTFVFVAGYIFVWTMFSLAAALAQLGLDSAALLSPMMVTTSPWLGSGLLIAAGLYQFLPWKSSCLKNCRSPVDFIARNWRNGRSGAFRLGVKHGWFCVGCCWVLMLLLFVGGVMNLFWIALITIFVLLEKVMPFGASGGKVFGGLMILVGLFLVFGAL